MGTTVDHNDCNETHLPALTRTNTYDTYPYHTVYVVKQFKVICISTSGLIVLSHAHGVMLRKYIVKVWSPINSHTLCNYLNMDAVSSGQSGALLQCV